LISDAHHTVEIFTKPINVDCENSQRGEYFQFPVQRSVTVQSVLDDTFVAEKFRDSLSAYRETRGHAGANLGGAHVDSLIAVHEPSKSASIASMKESM
jgi:hypothetical protein